VTEKKPKLRESVDCGWGRLIYGPAFSDYRKLAEAVYSEEQRKRNIAIYVEEPHVVLASAPQELFLNPSHVYRLVFATFGGCTVDSTFRIRRAEAKKDAAAISRIYSSRHMVDVDPGFIYASRKSRSVIFLIAEDRKTGLPVGTVMGVDHAAAFGDKWRGSSMWALAVDAQSPFAGVGEALTCHLIHHFMEKKLSFMDLSVMHDNAPAIALYEKMGFEKVTVFTIKHKNIINESLYSNIDEDEESINIYSRSIIDEARRRGIVTEVIDKANNFFSLSLGGRTVVCRESLTEMTSAIAMSRCVDKRVTNRLLKAHNLRVPAQILASFDSRNERFMASYKTAAVKPRKGEKGRNVFLGVKKAELKKVMDRISKNRKSIVIEEMVKGKDLRVIVIDFRVVAASIIEPPVVVGNGKHTVRQLIGKLSRRKEEATGKRSSIPIDSETRECVRSAGYGLDDVLPRGRKVTVRKVALVKTGGTIRDVTATLSRKLRTVAEDAARVIDIPVVEIDMKAASEKSDRYVIMEANERPGLVNHTTQPVVERFIDFLFPQSIGKGRESGNGK